MSISSPQEITQCLVAWNNGDLKALEQLAPLVHTELHRLAKFHMAGERTGHILQATALVNETYLRLIDWQNVEWRDRAHFFGLAAQIIRTRWRRIGAARKRRSRRSVWRMRGESSSILSVPFQLSAIVCSMQSRRFIESRPAD